VHATLEFVSGKASCVVRQGLAHCVTPLTLEHEPAEKKFGLGATFDSGLTRRSVAVVLADTDDAQLSKMVPLTENAKATTITK
jgi:hypothetical protein